MMTPRIVQCGSAAALAGALVLWSPAASADGAGCGAPCAGSCFSVNGSPGCDNEPCCESVCAQIPFCCVGEWSESCAAAAADQCGVVPCDCNNNGVPDDEDIAVGTSLDDNGNGVPDECELGPDCNGNGVQDLCDIDPGDPDENGLISPDANTNGIPDECEDCNGNGVPDPLDIDPGDPDGDGLVSFDCDGDGIPDECAVLCNLDVVFVLDTSSSMSPELPVACDDMIAAALDALAGAVQGEVRGTVLAISQEPVDCATGTVTGQLGSAIPGAPGACCSPMCTSGERCRENWGGATAIVAERFAWNPQALRIIVPVSDEGPCEGGTCEDPGSDRDSIENAVQIALDNGVLVFGVTGGGSGDCVQMFADDLGQRTGGRAWHIESGITWAEIGAALAAELASRTDARCTFCDADGDGVPGACECPWDLDCDDAVGVTDVLNLLAGWGACPVPAGCPADFNGDGQVGITDFLVLLANWGPCPDAGP